MDTDYSGHDAPSGSLEDLNLSEGRYRRLIEHSLFPPWTLLRESWKEDPKLLLPRMILESVRTARWIPRSLFLPRGEKRDAYVYKLLRRWAKRMCRLGQVKLTVIDQEALDPRETYLFAVNHMSPMDIPALYSAMTLRAAFVANAVFESIPVFSYWMRKSGSVFVNQQDPHQQSQAFRLMIRRLKGGRSLILFPEGYIYQGEGMAEFQRGGLHAALFANVPIVPLCVYGTQHVIRAGSLHITPRARVVVEFGKPIYPATLSRDERKKIEARVYKELSGMKARHASDMDRTRRR